MTGTVAVVGASVAGVRTAQALRRSGYRGTLRLVGEERELPYDRPPLSKAVLASTADPVRLLGAGQVEELGLQLTLGVRATGLDLAGRRLQLDDGSQLRFDAVVLATGARARPSPWQPGSGVHVLRTLRDCRALQADLTAGGPVVVVGGGFIGSEVAATCRVLGHDVTVVDPFDVPLARVTGEAVGRRLVDLHHRHGTRTRFGVGVTDITGTRGDLRVLLTDGGTLAAATVVVGIGAQPNDDWLRGSGLPVEDGVSCDEFGRTGAPGVYALGDLAHWQGADGTPGRRIEHWTNAVDQARCVARSIVAPDSRLPHHSSGFVWSDQYDWKLHVVGTTGPETVLVERPDGRFAALHRDAAGALCGAAVVNWPGASVRVRRHLAGGSAGTAPFDAALRDLDCLS